MEISRHFDKSMTFFPPFVEGWVMHWIEKEIRMRKENDVHSKNFNNTVMSN